MPSLEPRVLEQLLSIYELHALIKACHCINTPKREAIAKRLLLFANNNLNSDTISILSIGASQLKQELITAEILMQAGYNVKFILIEPIYYTQTSYEKLNYATLMEGFERISLELEELYDKQCRVIAAFPSLYFYFKTLLRALGQPVDTSILKPSFFEFQPLFGNVFFLSLPKEQTIDDCLANPIILNWSKQSSPGCLFIHTPSNDFVAYCCITTESKLIIENLDTRFSKQCNKLSEKLTQTASANTIIDLNSIITVPELKGIVQLLLQHTKVLASKKVHAILEEQLKNASTISASELLADIFMIVDSNNPKMENVIESLRIFFSEYVCRHNIFLNPYYLHIEGGYFSGIDMQAFNPILEIKHCLPFNYLPPPLKISNALLFSKFSRPSSKHPILPEDAINCIAGYLGV